MALDEPEVRRFEHNGRNGFGVLYPDEPAISVWWEGSGLPWRVVVPGAGNEEAAWKEAEDVFKTEREESTALD